MKVLIEAGVGEIEEKKSRFIAHLSKVSTVEEANAYIDSIKKQYWDARHNCSALIIGPDGSMTRCSDDGEPSGTAGRPMLETLIHSGLTDVVCVVTRYFGGTLLGTGGLVRAYTDAVNDAVAKSKIGEEIIGAKRSINLDYTSYGKVEHYLGDKGISVLESEFGADVKLTLRTTKSNMDLISGDIVNLTNGTAVFSDIEEVKYVEEM